MVLPMVQVVLMKSLPKQTRAVQMALPMVQVVLMKSLPRQTRAVQMVLPMVQVVPMKSLLKQTRAVQMVLPKKVLPMKSELKRLASLLTTHHLILNEEKDHESFVYRKQPFRWHLIFLKKTAFY